MKDFAGVLIKLIGLGFGALLLAFTGYQTYSLMLQITGNPLVSAIGLILFEGGMLYWWFVFQKQAEGLFQMAISLIVFITCLALVVIATALKLGAVNPTFLGEHTPEVVITVAALIQLAAKMFFPLVGPETMRGIMEHAMEGVLLAKTFQRFQHHIDEIAAGEADDMAIDWKETMRSGFGDKYRTDRRQLTSGNRTALPAPDAPKTSNGKRRPFFGRLRNSGVMSSGDDNEEPRIVASEGQAGRGDEDSHWWNYFHDTGHPRGRTPAQQQEATELRSRYYDAASGTYRDGYNDAARQMVNRWMEGDGYPNPTQRPPSNSSGR